MTRQERKNYLYLAVLFLLALLLILTCGCGRRTYIPIETSSIYTDTVQRIIEIKSTDTKKQKEYISDIRYDSVTPVLDSLGKVIAYDRWHFREITKTNDLEKSRLMSVIDSLRNIKKDSVKSEIPVYTGNEPTKSERLKMILGEAVMAASFIIVGLLIIFYVLKKRK